MKYDDASWHYGGDYPASLSDQNAFTHIGMFLAWALLDGLGGEIHLHELKDELESLRTHGITPGQYFRQICDGKLTNEDLNDKGNQFAEMYYKELYLRDYISTLATDQASPYHVEDTWENFEKISQVLSRRFDVWVSNS
jgi:hypothetical protein